MSEHHRQWDLHICALDKTCREFWGSDWEGDPPKQWWKRIPTRIHIATPWFHLSLAVLPGDWFYRGPGIAGGTRPWSLDRPVQ